MQIFIDKKFLKDLNNIDNITAIKKIKDRVNSISKVKTLKEIPNLKKMKGYKKYYRIKIGNFRIGFKYEDKKITVLRCLNRKDIYKYFP